MTNWRKRMADRYYTIHHGTRVIRVDKRTGRHWPVAVRDKCDPLAVQNTPHGIYIKERG